MKLNVEKVLSSSTLPRTMTMVSSTSFRYFDKLSTTIAFEAKCPGNQVTNAKHHDYCFSSLYILKKIVNQTMLDTT
jgi:hypothetical protein